jgi:hypothetical protein
MELIGGNSYIEIVIQNTSTTSQRMRSNCGVLIIIETTNVESIDTTIMNEQKMKFCGFKRRRTKIFWS